MIKFSFTTAVIICNHHQFMHIKFATFKKTVWILVLWVLYVKIINKKLILPKIILIRNMDVILFQIIKIEHSHNIMWININFCTICNHLLSAISWFILYAYMFSIYHVIALESKCKQICFYQRVMKQLSVTIMRVQGYNNYKLSF